MRQDHANSALLSSLALGYRPTFDLIAREVERRRKPAKFIKAKDMIPFLCEPLNRQDFITNSVDCFQRANPIYLDFSTADGPIICVSPTGSGKTFALRGLIGDLYNNGYLVADLSSVKNSLYWSTFPIQEKFRKWLPSWREPQALPIVPFTPRYVLEKQGLTKTKLEKMIVGQMALRDLDPADFWQSCLDLKSNEPKAEIIQNVWLPKYPPKDIRNLLDRISKVNATMAQRLDMKMKDIKFFNTTMASLVRSVGTLMTQKVFGDENPIDFVDVLKKGMIPSLCFNWCRDKDMIPMHSAYISALIRHIHRAKVKGTIAKSHRLVYFFDDIGTLACPRNRNPSCKDMIINDLVSLGREANEYVMGATQTLTQIPDELILQAKYFIFFGDISGDDLKRIAQVRKLDYRLVKEKLLYYKDRYGGVHPSHNRPLTLPDGRRSCVVWEKGGRAYTGWVPAPSSYHNEQD